MSALKLYLQDLVFVLKQIKIAEANAAGTAIMEIYVDDAGNTHDALGVPYTSASPGVTLAVPTPMSPYGLRTVDGSYNNLVPGREYWGAADQAMPRLLTEHYIDEQDGDVMPLGGGQSVTNTNYLGSGNVADADPRIISNLIVDQSINNPAVIIAFKNNAIAMDAWTAEQHAAGNMNPIPLGPDEAMVPGGVYLTNADVSSLPNIAPDEGLSAPFNAWMTFFGQFFDHGLDLINKGGNGTVYIPLQADDPLITHGPDGVAGTGDEVPPQQAFMVLTRASQAPGQESVNQTTPFVDQNQTYTSHASHQVFLREYTTHEGKTVATGHLLDGQNGNGLPTWADVKAQAAEMLGIALEDRDVLNIPLLRTDQYGNFIPDPVTGYAQVITGIGLDGVPNTADDVVISGTALAPINTFAVGALRIGHAFLDDIAHNAAPGSVFDTDGNPATPGTSVVQADLDDVAGNSIGTDFRGRKTAYDDELLGRHYITGDGRGNENFGLTTVHHIFHSEHNRQVEQQKLTILASGDVAFINEWLLDPITSLADINTPEEIAALSWDGARMFQSARMATEMQYQHLVFEEFARKIQPNIDPFVFNSSPDINPTIFAEFAHVVYRFGHSMLTDTMPRIDGNGDLMDDDGLIAAFLDPIAYNLDGTITDDVATAAVIRGMTIELGNEIDEFVVTSLRNNLVGLPLDLAALNIARGRETGIPSLNETRAQLYAASSSTFLKPYDHWVDFAANLKNPASVINFIAAYGSHPAILAATTLEGKRDAAFSLVMGGGASPLFDDRMEFLTGTGAWAGVETGLNTIDLWVGGLAEKKMPFGGMLGSTFNAIFELQLENLQDGDRFYYLTRTQGQHFLHSLEQNSFAKLIMANTDLAKPGADGIRGTADDIIERHIGVDSFAVYDYVLEVNIANQADYTSASAGEIAAAEAVVDAAQTAFDAAVLTGNTAEADLVDATADASAAQAAADASEAGSLRATANAAASAALALTTTAEFNALIAAATAANATNAPALQATADALQAIANGSDAVQLQLDADALQDAADLTDAVQLQLDADDLQDVADLTEAAQLQIDADALQDTADLTDADQLQLDADALQLIADTTNEQVDIDAAAAAQAEADAAAADDAAAAQAQLAAAAAAADDAAAAAAQLAASDAAAADAAASAAQAAAAAAVAADNAAAAAQAAAQAAVNADADLIAAVNAYALAVAADQAADATAASTDAAADTAEALDAAAAAAQAALVAATAAAAAAAAAEASALTALQDAQDALAAVVAGGPGKDPIGNDPVLEAAGFGKVVRDNPLTAGVDTNYLRFFGGEHIVAGGTNENDTIITDFGDDGIWGDGGNDRIESGAGVDLVNGGSGNDIITDSGDTGDFLKGDEGDDVIANSNGIDILMGGDDNDAIFVGVDDTEVFAGSGDDFVLGGDAVNLLMGNEGDDWLEAGGGFDTTAGDNSELNFDSRIIGHDVMFAGGDEHDFDGESGDDIMVQGESVMRSEGMFGFDWGIYQGNSQAANADLGIPIFTTEQADILRNRFDKVEGISGWNSNDTLTGSDRVYDPTVVAEGAITAGGEATFFRDEINQAGIDRIAGLDQVITRRDMFDGTYGSDFSNVQTEIFAGDVLLGGKGNDVLTGRAGNDILDGDRWLNVRIRLTAPGAENTAGNEIYSIDSMKHVFGADAPTAWVGKSLSELMIAGTIVPSQMHIVREVLSDRPGGNTDTAVFWDVMTNYSITKREDGAIIVDHVGFSTATVTPGTFRFSDGVDTLRNIEVLRFGDGAGGTEEVILGEMFSFAATGAPVISDTRPTEGDVLTANTADIADQNGLGTFSFQWQRSNNGTTWVNISGATSQTFSVPDAAGTALGANANQFLRVQVVFTDGFGDIETLTSAATARVGVNYDASGSANSVSFTGTPGDNIVVGSNFNDNLQGQLGDDIITGGVGNDFIGGGDGFDTAVFTGPATNYAFAVSGNAGIQVTDRVGNEGVDTLLLVERLRIGGVDYTIVNGTNGDNANLNGAAGAAGSQFIFGRQGADSLNGGAAADILVGGTGNDTVNGGTGDDFIFQTSTDGRDLINGGDGVDTYVLNGVAGAETFTIYAKAEYTGPFVLAANTEIVITRTVGTTTTVIAQLDNIEEIVINSLVPTNNTVVDGIVNGGTSAGDTINVVGNFAAPFTSLNYSTIHINGSNANETVDISGLTSAHRVVFDSNGGMDTIVGELRPQDVVTGITGLSINDLRVESGLENDFELMELVQQVDASYMLTLVDGMTMRSGLDAAAGLGGFGSTTLWSNDLDMFDRMDASGAGAVRQLVTDYSLV